ncbi:unnamed protein product [Mycena citricolor]|uniref:Uncharacterized protein n=1 Tax=Mycena citricolor TaxID=2018698 RepID=A0AAD2HTX6_9AGAR|nr:unnamed protein product [Mycena citricolor]
MSPGEGSRDTREKNTNRHALQPASLDPRPARRVYGRPRSVRRLPWARACRCTSHPSAHPLSPRDDGQMHYSGASSTAAAAAPASRRPPSARPTSSRVSTYAKARKCRGIIFDSVAVGST